MHKHTYIYNEGKKMKLTMTAVSLSWMIDRGIGIHEVVGIPIDLGESNITDLFGKC